MAQCKVHVADGPAQGETTYYWPLPRVLVLATKDPAMRQVWHDYKLSGTNTYVHSSDCPCMPDLDVLAW